ncbi:arginine N-succinyltransferase [Pseudomonas matsuisoli]|uniref:Arginine N-succinyltransferase n=1 Tax=Pseudomonas matsuisoli TaxID=1515666 RepID=A0A917PNJ0_9PSED|nr:arginine N-succinyltransferase [Pseudomonas matsuisoli]GGJ85437.1 arginine N-succinyltransferase subunit beta [Pseudomonas matsuisoli]
MIVRPVQAADLDDLLALARSAGSGLTTLPADAERLAHRVRWAEKTFARDVERADADYLFVMEDDAGQVVGITGLAGAVGLREPWYNYRLGMTLSASPRLGIHRPIKTLSLANDLCGLSEVCSLFLHADHRIGLNGKLLSKSRFLFLAEFASLFSERIIAEMRGVSDADGQSPFWDGLGRHFFTMPFARADYLTGIGNKSFIAELMPKFPVYTCFLPEAAQAAIGRVHPNTEPALRLLMAEGFSHRGYVDIFDGGAVVECETRAIRSVRESGVYVLAIGTPPTRAQPFLIYNRGFANCRMTCAPAHVASGALVVSQTTASRLALRAGDQVRAVSLISTGDAKP